MTQNIFQVHLEPKLARRITRRIPTFDTVLTSFLSRAADIRRGKTQKTQPAALLPLPRLNNRSKPTHSSEHLLSHKETSHVVCYHTSRGSIPSQEYTACFVSSSLKFSACTLMAATLKLTKKKSEKRFMNSLSVYNSLLKTRLSQLYVGSVQLRRARL